MLNKKYCILLLFLFIILFLYNLDNYKEGITSEIKSGIDPNIVVGGFGKWQFGIDPLENLPGMLVDRWAAIQLAGIPANYRQNDTKKKLMDRYHQGNNTIKFIKGLPVMRGQELIPAMKSDSVCNLFGDLPNISLNGYALKTVQNYNNVNI